MIKEIRFCDLDSDKDTVNFNDVNPIDVSTIPLVNVSLVSTTELPVVDEEHRVSTFDNIWRGKIMNLNTRLSSKVDFSPFLTFLLCFPMIFLYAILHQILSGIKDSINIFAVLPLFYNSARLKKIMLKIFFYNGVILCGSVCIIDYLKDYNYFHTFLTYFWIIPLCILSMYSNLLWGWKIHREYKIKIINNSSSNSRSFSLKDFIDYQSGNLMCLLTLFLYTIITYFLSSVLPLYFKYVMSSWVYAFYCFNYKWDDNDWNFQRKIIYFNRNWAYFLGYGLPSLLLCRYFDNYYLTCGLGHIIYPIHVLRSMQTRKPDELPSPLHINVFGSTVNFLNFIIATFKGGDFDDILNKSKYIVNLFIVISKVSFVILMGLNSL